jgi:hypothetical protein
LRFSDALKFRFQTREKFLSHKIMKIYDCCGSDILCFSLLSMSLTLFGLIGVGFHERSDETAGRRIVKIQENL